MVCRARPEIVVLPAAAIDGVRVVALDERLRTLEIDGGRLHPHVGLAPEQLQVGAFRAGMPARIRSLTCLYATRRTISVSTYDGARRCRQRGSRVTPSGFSPARAPRRARRRCRVRAVCRARASVVMATSSRRSLGQPCSCRHTHVGEEHFVESGDARHLDERPDRDAGLFISTSRKLGPCAWAPGSVRTTRMHWSAKRA